MTIEINSPMQGIINLMVLKGEWYGESFNLEDKIIYGAVISGITEKNSKLKVDRHYPKTSHDVKNDTQLLKGVRNRNGTRAKISTDWKYF